MQKLKPIGELAIPYPISQADEARDTSAWLGNELQNEAFEKLYSVSERVRLCSDRRLKQDWNYLQTADHFYYMCTKHQADGSVHSAYSPYETPYVAFTNYMNVLSDFIVRVEEQYPLTIENEELNSLLTTIRNQSKEIEQLNKELQMLHTNIIMDEENGEEKKPAKKTTSKAKKATEAKDPAKKATKAVAKKAPAKKTTKKA